MLYNSDSHLLDLQILAVKTNQVSSEILNYSEFLILIEFY